MKRFIKLIFFFYKTWTFFYFLLSTCKPLALNCYTKRCKGNESEEQLPRELHPGVGAFHIGNCSSRWKRRRFGRWAGSLPESFWSLVTLSSWDALGLDMSMSDSDEGAFPVGVLGGDSSLSAACFTSGGASRWRTEITPYKPYLQTHKRSKDDSSESKPCRGV